MSGANSGAVPVADIAYHEALQALFARTTGAWRLGLERVAGFLDRLGNPQRAYPVFHVAGTNGKGSTIATLDALLQGAGFRVGRYTSPHLVDFRERIVVNGAPMQPSAIVEFLKAWDPEAAALGTTFFEVTTAMALAHFAAQKVDVAVIEVGLGGRLDATNVVEPVATAVTQIGFDHMDYLGTTLPEIAREKGGIFKRGAAAVIGEQRPEIQRVLFEQAAAVQAAPILMNGQEWSVSDIVVDASGTSFDHHADGRRTRLHTPLMGAFQAHNAATALAMLRGAGAPWARAAEQAPTLLPTVKLAGRFHREGRFIFDVAHNPDGAATVAANVLGQEVQRPLVAIVSVLRDKDWQGVLTELGKVADQLILTAAPTAPESRAWNLGEVQAWAHAKGLNALLEPDFDIALKRASAVGATILVAGSFHTVGDAMERLQVDPLAR